MNSQVYKLFRCIAILWHIHFSLSRPIIAPFIFDGQHIHLPFPGFEFLDIEWLRLACCSLSFVFAVLALCDFRAKWTMLLSALFAVPFILSANEMRVAFHYFPLFTLFAFAVVEFVKHEAPLILLMSATYLTASLQKLAHFDDMFIRFPYQIRAMAPPELRDLVGMEGLLKYTEALASVVVPYEFLMGAFFLFSGTRLIGFAMAMIFHFGVAVTVGGAAILTLVSMNLLTVHAAIASYSANEKISEFFRRFSKVIFAWVLFGLLDLGTQFINELYNSMGGISIIVIRLLSRVGFLVGITVYFYRRKETWVNLFSVSIWRRHEGKILAVFTSILLLWSLSAKVNNYTSEHLGWAMFSGAARTKPIYCFSVQRVPCSGYFKLYPIITTLSYDLQYQYLTQAPSGLQKLRDRILETCPEAQPTAIQMHDPAGSQICRDHHLIF